MCEKREFLTLKFHSLHTRHDPHPSYARRRLFRLRGTVVQDKHTMQRNECNVDKRAEISRPSSVRFYPRRRQGRHRRPPTQMCAPAVLTQHTSVPVRRDQQAISAPCLRFEVGVSPMLFISEFLINGVPRLARSVRPQSPAIYP